MSAVDPPTVLAFALLVGGVLGSVLPLVPGPVLSLAGVLTYWWASGYAEPATPLLVALVALAGAGIAVDLFGGAVGAAAGGASRTATLAAAVVGLLALVATGPVGMLVGVAGTVFLVEFRRERDARGSLRAALSATAGVLGSALVQALVALAILAAVALVALV